MGLSGILQPCGDCGRLTKTRDPRSDAPCCSDCLGIYHPAETVDQILRAEELADRIDDILLEDAE